MPLARQIAAGRHVQRRYQAGDRIRVGDIEGTISELGLSTTRIEIGGGGFVDVATAGLIAAGVTVRG